MKHDLYLPYWKISREISGENSYEITREISRQNLIWNSGPWAATIPLTIKNQFLGITSRLLGYATPLDKFKNLCFEAF